MNKKIIASMLALLVAFSAGAAFAENETDENTNVPVITAEDSEDAEKEDNGIKEEDNEEEGESSEEASENEDILIAPAPTDAEEEETNKTFTLTLDEKRITDENDAVTEIDVAPCVIDGKVMLPFRAVFETLGAVISWDAETSTVFAVKNEEVFVLQIGQDVMYVNSEKVELEAPTVIVNDRTMISVDSVSKACGCNVEYSEEDKTIVIG